MIFLKERGILLKIVDSFRTGNEHEVINFKLIEVISKREKDIHLWLSKSHHNSLKRIDAEITRHKFSEIFNIRRNKLTSLLQYIVGFIYDITIYFFSEKIVFLTINPFSLALIKIINAFLGKKIYFVCHGELEILSPEGRNHFSCLMLPIALLFKFAFYLRTVSQIKFILLSKNVLENLLAYQPQLNRSDFIAVEHPYFFSEYASNKKIDGPLVLGTLGVNTIEKNSDKLFELAAGLEPYIRSGDIKISTTGPIKFNLEKCKNVNLVEINNNSSTMISRKDYEHLISKLDLVLFFYENDRYKLTASGALLDAINYKKPIIALKNSLFNYYFKSFGEMGILCENIEEMQEVIEENSAIRKNYNRYLENMEKAKTELGKADIILD